MNQHIVTEPSRTIRAIARQALSGNWIKMVIGVAIYSCLVSWIPDILSLFTSNTITINMEDLMNGEELAELQQMQLNTNQTVSYSYIADLYTFLLTGVFAVGFTFFVMTFLRTRKIEYGNIFGGFKFYFKTLWLYVLSALKIFVWGLLFVIPGIVAAFNYSQAAYIMNDHPDYSAYRCIKESTRMMKGNKGKLFCLCLSFIGWAILAYLATGVVNSLTLNGVIVSGGVVYWIAHCISLIPVLFLVAYMDVSTAAFHDLLTERLIPSRPEDRAAQAAAQEQAQQMQNF